MKCTYCNGTGKITIDCEECYGRGETTDFRCYQCNFLVGTEEAINKYWKGDLFCPNCRTQLIRYFYTPPRDRNHLFK